MTPSDPRSDDFFSRERLTAYLDGELSPAEARDVLAWLEAHPAALRELEEDRRVWALLSAYRDEQVPAGFSERVLAKAGVERAAAGAAPGATTAPALAVLPGGRARRYAAMAATVVLAVGVGALAANRFLGPSEPAPSASSALDSVPAALLESEHVANLASISDEEFDAILTADPEDLAQIVRAHGG